MAINVKVIWDFQNAWVRDETTAFLSTLKQMIQTSLRHFNDMYVVHELIAVGLRNSKFGKIQCYMDFFIELGDDNIRYGRPVCPNVVNNARDINNTISFMWPCLFTSFTNMATNSSCRGKSIVEMWAQ